MAIEAARQSAGPLEGGRVVDIRQVRHALLQALHRTGVSRSSPTPAKVIAGPCVMAMPPLLYLDVESRSRRHGLREESSAGAIDTRMKTIHEWLADRTKSEGLWLNDKNAVVGMSNINPLLQKKAKVKPSKLTKAKLGVVKTPKPFKAMVPFA